MNLYLAVQWGNLEDGANGDDTQVLVRAESFESCIKLAQDHLKCTGWKDGALDMIILLGHDLAKEQKEGIVNNFWFGWGFARGDYERLEWDHIDKKWVDSDDLHGQ